MGAIALRTLMVLLIAGMLIPLAFGILCTCEMINGKSEEDKYLRWKNTGVIIWALGCEMILSLGLIILFHEKNIFLSLRNILCFNESYRGLLKLVGLDVISLMMASCYLIPGKLRERLTEKRNYLFILIYTFCALVILGGLYEGIGSERYFSIVKVDPRINIHSIRANGPVMDLSGESKSVSIVVIKNNGYLPNNVQNMFISDSDNEPKGLLLDDVKLYPQDEYTCVLGDGALYEIPSDGQLFLSDSDGRIIDSFFYEDEDTKKKPVVPDFAVKGGFYDSDITVEITSSKENATIYYTLDGSIPTADSARYEGGIHIAKKDRGESFLSGKHITDDFLSDEISFDECDKATVLRAVSIDEDGNLSDIATQTYFIGLDQYKNSKVLSLVMDPDDLIGNHGIYVTGREYDDWYLKAFRRSGAEVDKTNAPTPNFSQRVAGYERDASIELFDDGKISLAQNVGVKIQGGSTRADIYKRFSVYSRKAYSDSKWFNSSIFDTEKTHSFVIRHNFENSFSQIIVKDRDIATQDSIKVSIFINGDYWCDTYLQEKYSEEMISEKYDISEDNVDLLKIGYIEDLTEDQMKIYDECIGHFVQEADLKDEKTYKEFCSKVDIQSYIDFVCTNIYLANEDIDDGKNYVLFRAAEKENDEYGDGKLRWGLYDMDLLRDSVRFEKDYEMNAMIDTFRDKPPLGGEAFANKPLFSALLKNADFREQFKSTFIQMADNDFAPDRIDKLMKEYNCEVDVAEYDDGFFVYRKQYIIDYLNEVIADAENQ